MKTLQVRVPGAAYPIHIGAGTSHSHLPEMIAGAATDLVVTVSNGTLEGLYPGLLERQLGGLPLRFETCLLPDGERYKTLETLETIYGRLMELEANRKTLLVAFGGGVVGDITGFAAATFMRGIPFVQVPTTLLAQVDSSVGGKTGVNLPTGKNAVGAFKQPAGVVIDLEFLATLPPRELRAGLFELIKHGIIRDAGLFGFLESNGAELTGMNWDFWEEAVHRSCIVKAQVVEEDEREQDLRAILNFGHSVAHLIETHTNYTQYLHGEAVGAGMMFAAYLSSQWGMISGDEYGRISRLLEPLIAPVVLPPLDQAAFTTLLMHDKKASGRTLRFVLLQALGRAVIREETDPAELWPIMKQFMAEHPEVIRMAGGNEVENGR